MHNNLSVDYFKSLRISPYSTEHHFYEDFLSDKTKKRLPSYTAWEFVYTPINLNTLKAVINTKIPINPR